MKILQACLLVLHLQEMHLEITSAMTQMPRFFPFILFTISETDTCCVDKILKHLVTSVTQRGSEDEEGFSLFKFLSAFFLLSYRELWFRKAYRSVEDSIQTKVL